MTSDDLERHARLSHLFAQATILPANERRAFAEERSQDDQELRIALLELIDTDAASTPPEDEDANLRAARARLLDVFESGDTSPAAAVDALPEKLGEHRVLRRLGAGSMGTVYEVAVNGRDSERAALKLLSPTRLSYSALKRFQREGTALARLQHEGIARIHATGEADLQGVRRPFLLMEYIEGLPLAEHVRDHRLGAREIVEVVRKVALATAHAHERGVVHRDLKPENVIVDEAGHPKVLDFGVARLIGDGDETSSLQTAEGQLIGTLAYMSPEQIGFDSHDIDGRCDVYALGIVLHELLTAKPLDKLDELSLGETVMAIRGGFELKPSRDNPEVDADLDAIVGCATAVDPDRRYADMTAFALDLQNWLEHLPIAATRSRLSRALGRFSPSVEVGIAILLIGMLVALVATR